MTRVTEQMGSLSPPVSWLGMTAVYTPVERQIMSALPVPEQRRLHVLKALGEGEIHNAAEPTPQRPTGEMIGPYTDPDDIEFGEAPKKRKKPVYALVWTHRKHRIYKTKAKAQVKLKAWKRWYERQGWKVTSHSTGYFAVRYPDATLQGAAAKGGERHAISLHEYDRDTNERIK